MATPAAARDRIPHPPRDAIDLATVMRTVGDPLRLDIVRLLADGREMNCQDLNAQFGLPTSTGSYHLRLLREAGVTRTRAEGARTNGPGTRSSHARTRRFTTGFSRSRATR